MPLGYLPTTNANATIAGKAPPAAQTRRAAHAAVRRPPEPRRRRAASAWPAAAPQPARRRQGPVARAGDPRACCSRFTAEAPAASAAAGSEPTRVLSHGKHRDKVDPVRRTQVSAPGRKPANLARSRCRAGSDRRLLAARAERERGEFAVAAIAGRAGQPQARTEPADAARLLQMTVSANAARSGPPLLGVLDLGGTGEGCDLATGCDLESQILALADAATVRSASKLYLALKGEDPCLAQLAGKGLMLCMAADGACVHAWMAAWAALCRCMCSCVGGGMGDSMPMHALMREWRHGRLYADACAHAWVATCAAKCDRCDRCSR
eukprot:363407-Chlamydomonas_euryale.AAC.5